MARRRSRGSTPKEKRAKKVNFSLVKREHGGKTVEVYRYLDELVGKYCEHLKDAKIAIAWRFGWKADTDGRIVLGGVKKGSDLDRELHGWDFVVMLNHEVFNQAGFRADQKKAVILHQLCHCQLSKDTNGEPKKDEAGRTVYRMRKHDIEEFTEVLAAFGCVTSELEAAATILLQKAQQPLLKDDDKKKEVEKQNKETNKVAKGRAAAGKRLVSKALRQQERLKKKAGSSGGADTIPMHKAASPAK